MNRTDDYWLVAFLSGTVLTFALFMVLPSLRFQNPQTEEPVIVIDFMQWREPTPLPKPAAAVKPVVQKPKPLLKPRQIQEQPKAVEPSPKPEIIKHPTIDPESQRTIEPAPEQPKPEQIIPPEPATTLPVDSKEHTPQDEPLPVAVPLFKLTNLPRFAHKVEPEYPQEMRSLGKEATVKLELLIDRNGKVRKVTVLNSGGAAFDAAATKAMLQSSFVPGNIEGESVAVRMRIPIKFSLR